MLRISYCQWRLNGGLKQDVATVKKWQLMMSISRLKMKAKFLVVLLPQHMLPNVNIVKGYLTQTILNRLISHTMVRGRNSLLQQVLNAEVLSQQNLYQAIVGVVWVFNLEHLLDQLLMKNPQFLTWVTGVDMMKQLTKQQAFMS